MISQRDEDLRGQNDEWEFESDKIIGRKQICHLPGGEGGENATHTKTISGILFGQESTVHLYPVQIHRADHLSFDKPLLKLSIAKCWLYWTLLVSPHILFQYL